MYLYNFPCTTAFSLSEATLRRRLAGGVSHSSALEHEHYLSVAEEQTLVLYISRVARF